MAPDEKPEDQHSYALVMPFVCVASKGGPYDDESYVAGYEAGALGGRLMAGERGPTPIHRANLRQADLVAMLYGHDISTTTDYGPDWVVLEFTPHTTEPEDQR